MSTVLNMNEDEGLKERYVNLSRMFSFVKGGVVDKQYKVLEIKSKQSSTYTKSIRAPETPVYTINAP